MKNTSTERIDNNKNFDVELHLIEYLFSLHNKRVRILDHEDIEAHISKENKTFSLRINARLKDDDDDSVSFSFALGGNIYEAQKLGSIYRSTELKVNKNVHFNTTIELKSFHSKDFNNKKGLYKTFFEVDENDIQTFHNQFETVTYKRNKVEHFYDCLRITLNKKQYDLTQLKENGRGFYVFECLEQQAYEEFSEVCFSTQQAVGFLNKLMVGSEKVTFDETGKLYYTNYIRPSIRGMYSPISTNPYSHVEIGREFSDKFVNKLTRFTLDNLSNLISKIHTEPDFSVAILVILEATSIRSLLVIPSSFAVIIELLSKHLSINESGLEKPIADYELQEQIIRELHKVIDNNSETLNDESILKLKRRLNEINKPVNKQHLTNNEKLTKPFEQLGISLTLHDVAIIEHRNDLLHGNILLKSNEVRDLDKSNLYMTYVSAKLFTLISKLILKSIGYTGYVYNQAKYLEKHMNIETHESFFEKI